MKIAQALALGLKGALDEIEVRMPVSRRKFLQNGAIATAALIAAPLDVWSAVPGVNPASHSFGRAQRLSRQAFEQAVGSSFQVSSAGANAQPVWLTLQTVTDLPVPEPINAGIMAVPPPQSSTSTETTGFILSFHSSAPPLPQGTYAFQHHALGKFELFIVPGSPATQSYTAVFNVLVAGTTSVPDPPRLNPRRPIESRDDGENGGGLSSSSPNGTTSSKAGRPAQEQLEPVFRNRLESKLPE